MSPTGPFIPTTVAQSGTATSWTNLNNAKVEDGLVASCAGIGPGGTNPNQLNTTGFGFNIPSSAIIDGIKLEIKVQTTSGVQASDSGLISLLYNGGSTSPSNTPNSGQFWPTSALTWLTYGGSTSLWGRTWTPADINNASFGASMAAFPGSGTATINVDAVRITIYWHTAPADVPKRYVYKVFNYLGTYLGNLPNVISEFSFSEDINTVGSQITVECGVSADTSWQPADTYTDESGTPYTDETGLVNYTTEGVIPIVSPGSAGYDTLIKDGNLVVVYEYGYYYPNGVAMFSGQINRWEASFGGDNDADSIKILIYSDGADMDNYVARGAPFSYTTDQSQTSQNSNDSISASSISYNYDGQTFKVGTGVTNIGAINLMLNGTAEVTVNLYDGPGKTTLLGSTSQNVSVGAATVIQFAFAAPITVTAGLTYYFEVVVANGQSITIYYQNTDVYTSGSRYTSTYSGTGGGSPLAAIGDLYFVTASSAGSTTGTYTNVDPSTGMLKPIIDDYVARGGLINYASGTVDATGLSITYTLNTNTVFEALKAVLSLAPNGYYFRADLGTRTLYFKNSSTTADYTLVRGKHITSLKLVSTIENIKNQVLFSGGATGGVNLYKQYQSTKSIASYGVRLDRKSDNRVTVSTTADAIGNSAISELKDEQYQTVVTILDKTMDITLLTPGKIIGFAGFGTFVDNILAQIVRRDYTPYSVTLTLGILPKRLTPEFEKITRGLIAQQTIANPSAPS